MTEQIKLSEAIRKGCEGTRKIRGRFINNGKGCCAIGAAFYGIGLIRYEIDTLFDPTARLEGRTGCDITWAKYDNPLTGKSDSLFSIITWLNDDSSWSREQIADWLESEGL